MYEPGTFAGLDSWINNLLVLIVQDAEKRHLPLSTMEAPALTDGA